MENNASKCNAFSSNEELEFLRNVIEKIPAIVYINELERPNDPTSIKNVYLSPSALSFVNLTQEEVTKMGNRFLDGIIHPDDMDVVPVTVTVSNNFVEETTLISMYRLKLPGKDSYSWYYCHGRIISTFEDGSPCQLLTVGLEVTDTMHTQQQLAFALKEISRLKHALKLSNLSDREKEVLRLIVKGKTDKSISEKLNISIQTAKKHRNNLILKTEVNNTAELVALAVEAGEH